MLTDDSFHSGITLVLLAAGRGTRMANTLQVPKPLAPVGGEPLLQRTLRQFHEVGIHDFCIVTGYEEHLLTSIARANFPDVRIVHNARFAEDRNILSLLLAFRTLPPGQAALVVEGDVVLSDAAVKTIAGALRQGKSFWTACGNFCPGQVGGILRADVNGSLREIRYATYHDELRSWHKNLGVIFVAPDGVEHSRKLLEAAASESLDAYFMLPWQEHLDELPAMLLDVGKKEAATFNTPEEYQRACLIALSPDVPPCPSPTLVEVSTLRHIEAFDSQRVSWLVQKIFTEQVWTMPLAVSNEHSLVMDGQHRMEAARALGLRHVPAVLFDYAEVPVHSLREGWLVTTEEIIRRALTDNIYPYKTAKHVLPPMPTCHIPLTELR